MLIQNQKTQILAANILMIRDETAMGVSTLSLELISGIPTQGMGMIRL